MKIAFLVGGLEAGATGVGDYTRLVADELLQQGHECTLIALNDRSLSQAEPVKETTPSGAPILRLPAQLSWDDKVRLAKAAVDAFNPDWVSWQFVCYSYNPKGIVSGLESKIAPIIGNRPLQMMFHELWIGYGEAPLKDKLVGQLQSRAITKLLKALKPRVVHTSNDLYSQRLRGVGIQASVLPLFGNIPMSAEVADEWLWPLLQDRDVEINSQNRSNFWLFCFFGALFSIWAPEPFFSYVAKAAKETNRRVVILSMGRIGEGEGLWNELVARYPQFTFLVIGGQPGEKVAQVFNSIDFGIAATPYALIGKSGSTAAMLESGLPVIVTRDDIKGPGSKNVTSADNARDNSLDSQLVKMDDTLAARLVAGLPRVPAAPRLPMVARRFVETLKRS